MRDGGGPPGSNHIDPANLPLRLVGGVCTPVLPHEYLQANTVMEVPGRERNSEPATRVVVRGGRPGAEVDDRRTDRGAFAPRTLIVVGAKHGQSPIDVHALHMMPSRTH